MPLKTLTPMTPARTQGTPDAKPATAAKPLAQAPALGAPAESTAAQRRVLGDVAVSSAKKGFGLFLSDRQAGAKAAVAGLGFFDQGVGKHIKKGVLGALLGVALLTGVMPTSAPSTSAPAPRSSLLDVRAMNMQAPHKQQALSDAQTVLAQWQDEKDCDPTFTVTSDRARTLVLAALLPAKPGAREDLASFATGKLGGPTKQLLATLLDGQSFPLAADAKALLEVLSDRVHISADGKVKITGDQKDGKLRLAGAAGATIEAVNLSSIPTKRIAAGETFVVGTIGQDGKFVGDMAMQAGDQVRVRLKLPDGKSTDWVQFNASGLGADTRNAELALFRIGLSDAGSDKVDVTNINSSRTISEPGALVRFVNARTSVNTDVRINKDGSFDAGTKLAGKPGDTFSVRVSDGTNDTAFAKEVGKLKVGPRGGGSSQIQSFDLPDPGLHKDELDETGKAKFSMERFRGPLFDIDGAKAGDVQQGQIGDCYLPAAVAAIAHHVPGHFEKMIVQKSAIDAATGSEKIWFEVTFQEKKWENGKSVFKPVVQTVDADLFVRSYGGPLYGADDGPRTIEDMELWWPILEKAYADWQGDYNTIGDGGSVGDVFRDMLGVDTSSMTISAAAKDDVWKKIVASVDGKQPVGAGTHGHDQDALYANSGVYANHAYSILGYEKATDGTRFVKLRNPWGESEPFPGDGKNDGIFKLKLDTFVKLYSNLYATGR